MGRPCRLLLQALYPYGTPEHPRTRPIHLSGSGCVGNYSRTVVPEASGDWRDTLVQALLPASCWIEEFSLYGNDEPFEWEAPPHECVCCACCKLDVSGSCRGCEDRYEEHWDILEWALECETKSEIKEARDWFEQEASTILAKFAKQTEGGVHYLTSEGDQE